MFMDRAAQIGEGCPVPLEVLQSERGGPFWLTGNNGEGGSCGLSRGLFDDQLHIAFQTDRLAGQHFDHDLTQSVPSTGVDSTACHLAAIFKPSFDGLMAQLKSARL